METDFTGGMLIPPYTVGFHVKKENLVETNFKCVDSDILSSPKIFPKDIQIFQYFLRMMDFGHVREFLKKIDLNAIRWIYII